MAEPTPKILEIIIQDEVLQGEATIITNSRSATDVRPVSLASTLDLSLQGMNSEKFRLVSNNDTLFYILFELSFTLTVFPSKSIYLSCLASVSTQDLKPREFTKDTYNSMHHIDYWESHYYFNL